TSEKQALGRFLDGEVSAVLGTHTHVQTADETILPGGTAYISDAGMTGPHNSVIGIEKDMIVERFLTGMPCRFEVARGDVRLQGVVVDVDPQSGRARAIKRVNLRLKE
ncbi:MAG TPA: YmdB family metallophosphoesterase, partial [Syntrophales bacterium]|nr:YmdB family metallophosphoesterase [Syntrophales bacterium]